MVEDDGHEYMIDEKHCSRSSTVLFIIPMKTASSQLFFYWYGVLVVTNYSSYNKLTKTNLNIVSDNTGCSIKQQ